MRTELSYLPVAGIATELLAVLAADTQTAKGPEAKPQLMLLTTDAAVQAAAAGVLGSGEYKAGANETVLLHAPAGLAAKRLLIVGLGKLAKATVHWVRDAAGTAVRFAKPRGIREVVLGTAYFGKSAWRSRAFGPRLKARLWATSTPTPTAATARTRAFSRSRLPFRPARVAGEADRAAVEAAFAEGVIVGESQNFTRTLVNEPGNKLTPDHSGAARGADGAGGWAGVRSVFHGEAARAEDGRVLERLAGLSRAAGADCSAL